jgi:hypothetical protein
MKHYDFLIVFTGVKLVKDSSKSSADLIVCQKKLIKSFGGRSLADKWAKENINSFLEAREKWKQRSWSVDEISTLRSREHFNSLIVPAKKQELEEQLSRLVTNWLSNNFAKFEITLQVLLSRKKFVYEVEEIEFSVDFLLPPLMKDVDSELESLRWFFGGELRNSVRRELEYFFRAKKGLHDQSLAKDA